ncbi:MAG: methionyl aminopeptidase [Deltaproteobacteria bacterium]|nr:methionyl aminopeptidase [Deltaproteobacteria bacterium]
MMLKSSPAKTGRNDPCPCGSGLKYKKCCLNKASETSGMEYMKKKYLKKFGIHLNDKKAIEGIRVAGRLVIETLDLVEKMIAPGITTDEINTVVHSFAVEHDAIPAPLNYKGFPKSVCTSVNDVICHGIPDDRILVDGDIINVDVTHIYKGFYADASKTYFVGTPGENAKKIVDVSATCLKKAMSMLEPAKTIGDIGWAIQQYAQGRGCSVVREFVGHGVGKEFHEPPQVPHYGKKGAGIPLVPGMVFTVEPMINLGRAELFIEKDGWTAVTADHCLSAQFEQTFLITEHGYESLTPYEL